MTADWKEFTLLDGTKTIVNMDTIINAYDKNKTVGQETTVLYLNNGGSIEVKGKMSVILPV